MNKFRTLRADEIDCRVSQVKSGQNPGVLLLLYKDARCDQNILDETVGPLNWMRHHSRDNANCTVAIWDEKKAQWIEKEDTGVESRTEKEKGLASDSFKRACFNWGIGRELYTAPFIFVPADKCNIRDGKCYDNFTVEEIEYQPDGQREIRKLVIYNEKKHMVCYRWEIGERKAAQDTEPQAPAITPAKPALNLAGERIYKCEECGIQLGPVLKNGRTISVEDQLRVMTNYTQKIVCPACLKKIVDALKEGA